MKSWQTFYKNTNMTTVDGFRLALKRLAISSSFETTFSDGLNVAKFQNMLEPDQANEYTYFHSAATIVITPVAFPRSRNFKRNAMHAE
jgi:hypothetical protein